MKINTCCILVVFYLTSSFQTNAQDRSSFVYLSGKINYLDNQVQVEDMSEMKDLTLPSDERTFVPDSAGKFSIKFLLKEPNYFRVGRNILYLSPGDNLEMNIDYDYPDKSTFKGKAAPINEYLKFTPFPKGGSYLNSKESIKATIEQTIDAIFVESKARERILFSNATFPKEFISLENERIKADVINSLKSILIHYPYAHKIKGDSLLQFEHECQKAIQPYIDQYLLQTFNSTYLDIVVYRFLVLSFFGNEKYSANFSPQTKDWIKARQIVEKIRDFNIKDSIIALESTAKEIKTSEYRNAVLNTINQSLKFRNGDVAINFIASDIKNRPIALNSFSGKVIFIDVWATWCIPCVKEIPYLDSLREKYKNNANVVFISLSIDEVEASWKKHLLAVNAPGIQCIIDRNKLKDYTISEMPRTIIIDKNFKVVEMNGPLPSSKEAIKTIESLLN